jgi:hypothetical protein
MNLYTHLPDLVGMMGVSMVLLAYYLLNINRVHAISYKYLTLNLVGSILILYSLMFHWNLSSVIIEIAWITISLIGFYRAWRKKGVFLR